VTLERSLDLIDIIEEAQPLTILKPLPKGLRPISVVIDVEEPGAVELIP